MIEQSLHLNVTLKAVLVESLLTFAYEDEISYSGWVCIRPVAVVSLKVTFCAPTDCF